MQHQVKEPPTALRALLEDGLACASEGRDQAVVLCAPGQLAPPAEALGWFERARQADPSDLLPYAALADGYLRAGQYRQAVEQADRIWARLDLTPYRGKSLSVDWPSVRRLLDPKRVAAWAVALGQRAYLNLARNDPSLTRDNQVALNSLAQLDLSVGDWRTYRCPPTPAELEAERRAKRKKILIGAVIVYLLLLVLASVIRWFSSHPIVLLVAAAAIFLLVRWQLLNRR